MSQHRAQRDHSIVRRTAGRGALTAAVAVAVTGGPLAGMAFADTPAPSTTTTGNVSSQAQDALAGKGKVTQKQDNGQGSTVAQAGKGKTATTTGNASSQTQGAISLIGGITQDQKNGQGNTVGQSGSKGAQGSTVSAGNASNQVQNAATGKGDVKQTQVNGQGNTVGAAGSKGTTTTATNASNQTQNAVILGNGNITQTQINNQGNTINNYYTLVWDGKDWKKLPCSPSHPGAIKDEHSSHDKPEEKHWHHEHSKVDSENSDSDSSDSDSSDSDSSDSDSSDSDSSDSDKVEAASTPDDSDSSKVEDASTPEDSDSSKVEAASVSDDSTPSGAVDAGDGSGSSDMMLTILSFGGLAVAGGAGTAIAVRGRHRRAERTTV